METADHAPWSRERGFGGEEDWRERSLNDGHAECLEKTSKRGKVLSRSMFVGRDPGYSVIGQNLTGGAKIDWTRCWDHVKTVRRAPRYDLHASIIVLKFR